MPSRCLTKDCVSEDENAGKVCLKRKQVNQGPSAS
ncbi:hypothetical protein POX_f08206 [Penicillium oxalicum]|nr:hypothetical protein POX_f08206 [Penicillium oxalicum]KAI2787828.1 hypothetical protein POX_f08206 [Penicillium oxalicum]